MKKIKKNSNKSIFIFFLVLLAIFNIFIIYFIITVPIMLWDYKCFYLYGLENYNNSNKFYGINYLPSFFLLAPILNNIYIYIVFLVICCQISNYFILKLVENKIVARAFILTNYLFLFSGNIDIFIMTIALICFYYKKNDFITIPLAFACFKISVFVIVFYFFIISKNRVKFLTIFATSFITFNYYFLIHFSMIFEFLSFGYELGYGWLNILMLIRPCFILSLYLIITKKNYLYNTCK